MVFKYLAIDADDMSDLKNWKRGIDDAGISAVVSEPIKDAEYKFGMVWDHDKQVGQHRCSKKFKLSPDIRKDFENILTEVARDAQIISPRRSCTIEIDPDTCYTKQEDDLFIHDCKAVAKRPASIGGFARISEVGMLLFSPDNEKETGCFTDSIRMLMKPNELAWVMKTCSDKEDFSPRPPILYSATHNIDLKDSSGRYDPSKLS